MNKLCLCYRYFPTPYVNLHVRSVGMKSKMDTIKIKFISSEFQSAIIENNCDKVRSLCQNCMKNSIKINDIRLTSGTTILSFAVYRQLSAIVAVLVESCDANLLSVDHLGRIEPPICTAVRLGNKEISKLLLSTETANPNQVDYFNRTPIWWAVKVGRLDLVELILSHETFRLDHKYFYFRDSSPVYLAAKYVNKGLQEILERLIKSGFEHYCNGEIATLVQCNSECAKLLHECGVTLLNQKLNKPRCLKAMTRIIIRNRFVINTRKVVNNKNLSRYFPFLPTTLLDYISNLA